MTKRAPALLACIALLPALGGCGLHPVYSGGSHGAVATQLGAVEVAPIPGKAGWLVHNALADRLGAMPDGQAPRYRLVVQLNDDITGLGVRANETVTRERRTLRARYQLVDAAAPANAVPLLDEAASVDAGIDVASSEYATVAAEDTALERLSVLIADRIIARLATRAAHQAER